MSKRERTRTRDVNTTAFRIVQEATGEKPKRRPPETERAQNERKKPDRRQAHPEG